MVEVTFLIPTTDNDGGNFTPLHHTRFLRMVMKHFGGATFLPNMTEGVWRNAAGTVFTDRCRLLVVAVGSLTVSGEKLRRVARDAARHYRQEAILFRYLGVSEVFEV